jgi:hypothetical protein
MPQVPLASSQIVAPALPIGKQTIYVPAGAMLPRVTAGAATGAIETTTNRVNVGTLDFDTTTQEFAQFSVAMPKSWNAGALSYQAVWTHGATTTNFGVVWSLSGMALSDKNPLETAFGSTVTIADVGGTTNAIYITAEIGALTLSNAPAENDYVVFQIARVPADAADTMAVDARLLGVRLFYTTNAGNDAYASQPNFDWSGSNAALREALVEAAQTGLVTGFSSPSSNPQYWLRGVSYPAFLAMAGASYARSGARAGTNPAVSFASDVLRLEEGQGVRVFDAQTNLCRSSAAPPTQSFTVTAVAHTLSFFGTGSITLSGVGTGTLVGTGATNRVSLTFTPTAGTLTLTVSGSVTFTQVETGTFATDYTPNASPSASASVGADALGLQFASPTEYTVIVEWIEPYGFSGFPRIIGVDTLDSSLFFLNASTPTILGSFNGTTAVSGSTGARAAGSVQRLVLRQSLAGRTLHYNGAQIGTGASILAPFSAIYPGSGSSNGVAAWNSAIRIVAIVPRDIGATSANAVSVLP